MHGFFIVSESGAEELAVILFRVPKLALTVIRYGWADAILTLWSLKKVKIPVSASNDTTSKAAGLSASKEYVMGHGGSATNSI